MTTDTPTTDLTEEEAQQIIDSIQESGLDALDLIDIFRDPALWLAESESGPARRIRGMREGMAQPDFCERCSETYDRAHGHGDYGELCSRCGRSLSDHLIALSNASTPDQARDAAIDFQHWQSGESLSYSELAEIQTALESLAERFPTLHDEFRENGLI